MQKDARTLAFYRQEAAAYTSRRQGPSVRRIATFLSTLPAGATILELGCGAGQDSEFMIAKGYDVRPTDGTREIAQAAERRLGIPVATLLFGDLDESSTYDGVWAKACLLHIPREELARVLGRIHRVLRHGGVFYASFKAGDAEGRDQFGRYYNYPSQTWLNAVYAELPWETVTIEADQGSGYDRKPTDWLHATAVKPRDPLHPP